MQRKGRAGKGRNGVRHATAPAVHAWWVVPKESGEEGAHNGDQCENTDGRGRFEMWCTTKTRFNPNDKIPTVVQSPQSDGHPIPHSHSFHLSRTIVSNLNYHGRYCRREVIKYGIESPGPFVGRRSLMTATQSYVSICVQKCIKKLRRCR